MKLLVVEDDKNVARFLKRALAEEGFVVDWIANGADALSQVGTGVYDAMIVDWMLPDIDGLTVCREIRRSGANTPVLMLTARGEVQERVLGLDAGADDYLVKPFHVDELLARVRALLRRTGGAAVLRCGPIEIDRLQRRVRVSGVVVDLTTREYGLLAELAARPDQTVKRTELLARVWDSNFDTGSNIVEVHVSHLREKLGTIGALIETVRGVGYRLRPRVPT